MATAEGWGPDAWTSELPEDVVDAYERIAGVRLETVEDERERALRLSRG